MLANNRQRYLLAFASGGVSALATPPFDLFFVLFLSFPALVWILDGCFLQERSGVFNTIKSGFFPGWFFGFGYFLFSLWWIGNAFLVEADEFAWLLPVAVVALPAMLACFWGLATLLCRPLWHEGIARTAILAAILAFCEFLRGTLFTGFPWNAIGYSSMPHPIAMQAVSLAGINAMSLYTVLVACIPLVALSAPLATARVKATAIVIAGLLVAAHLGFGYWRLGSNPTGPETSATVRLVQPNIPQKDKFNVEMADRIVSRYIRLSAGPPEPSERQIDYFIWPESAFPFLLTERADVLSAIGQVLPEGTHLVTGAMRSEPAAADEIFGPVYNSIYLINGDGEITEAYDKVHLVPFGEYLPYQAYLEAIGLEQLTQLRGGFTAGSSRSLMGRETVSSFLPLICYEILFSREVRSSIRKGIAPDWIVNLTNDAWFGATPGPYQHQRQAIVRGVETGLPVIRVANTGVSSASDGFGRIIAEIPLGEEGIRDVEIPSSTTVTFYIRLGEVPFFILVILTLIGGRMEY